MEERLYTTHADCYDALYRELKDYDREVEFVVNQFESKRRTDSARTLILGCGSGEHARRLVTRGFDVLGVDKYEEMLDIARGKSDAAFRIGALPDVDVSGTFDLILLPFTVVNHLGPDELEPALRNVDRLLATGGVLVFDNGAFPSPDDDLPAPSLTAHSTDIGEVARLTQIWPQGDGRVRWNSVVFVQERGEFFVDTHDLTVFDDDHIEGLLEAFGFDVDTADGYGTGGSETVFVARRRNA